MLETEPKQSVALSASASRFGRTIWLWVTAGLILLLYLLLAGGSTLFDRDEPRFARAAVEMYRAGEFFVPTFDGQERLHKPAGVYWLMMGGIALLGETTLAVRLPSVLAVMGVALLTGYLTRQVIDRRLGPLAMVIVAGNPLMWQDGQGAIADAVLLFFITWAGLHFIRATQRDWCWRDTLILGLAMGGGQLVKGPVILLLPVAMWLTLWWSARKGQRLPRGAGGWPISAHIWLAVAISFVLFLAWAVPANNATDGRFLEEGIGKHVIQRFFGSQEGHGQLIREGVQASDAPAAKHWLLGIVNYVGGALLIYPAVIIVGFFPWVTLLFPAIRTSLRKTTEARDGESDWRQLFMTRFLLCWCAVFFMFFTLMAARLPHYILPIWPAMTLLIVSWVARVQEGEMSDSGRKWLAFGHWFMSFGWVGVGVALLAVPWVIQQGVMDQDGQPWSLLFVDLAWPMLCMGAVMLAMWVGFTVTRLRGQLMRGVTYLALGALLMQFIMGLGLLPAQDRWKSSPQLAKAMREIVAASDGNQLPEFCTIENNSPALRFYAGLQQALPSMNSADQEGATRWLKQQPGRYLILPKDRLEKWFPDQLPGELIIYRQVTGLREFEWETQCLITSRSTTIDDE